MVLGSNRLRWYSAVGRGTGTGEAAVPKSSPGTTNAELALRGEVDLSFGASLMLLDPGSAQAGGQSFAFQIDANGGLARTGKARNVVQLTFAVQTEAQLVDWSAVLVAAIQHAEGHAEYLSV